MSSLEMLLNVHNQQITMIIRTIIIMLAILIMLAACVNVHPTASNHTGIENFLNLTDYRASIFIYKNYNGHGYAIAVFKDGKIDMVSGNHLPLTPIVENYKGVEIKLLGNKAWAFLDGITVTGNIKLVKDAINARLSGKNVYKFLKCKNIYFKNISKSIYLCILKGDYCPYCSKLKVVYAEKYGDGYNVYSFYNGVWSSGWLKNIENIGTYITSSKKMLEITASNYKVGFKSLNLQVLKAQA